MIEVILAKLASLGLAAKAGAVTGALAISGSALAVTGTLPEPAQNRVADAVEQVAGLDLPGGSQADGHRQDGQHRQDGDAGVDAADADNESDVAPASQDEFSRWVSDSATDGVEDGAQFGEDVSTRARETFAPTDQPTAEANPGTQYREQAPTQAPDSVPTAEDNPGTDDSGAAPTQAPDSVPTAEENAGTEHSDEAPSGAPEPLPIPEENPSTNHRP